MTTSTKLPRGRHGLSREEVVGSQRERLLRAMTEAVAQRGYVDTPVAAVIKRAGVSRETFYEHFDGKEACFLAAHDAAVDTMLDEVRGADPSGTGRLERFTAALDAYLAAIAADPAGARTFLVEVYAAGPDALARRVALQTRFVDALTGLLDAESARERFACEALTAAISSLVTQRVCLGEYADIPALRTPIVELVREALA